MFFCEYILLFKSFLDIKKQIYYVASWWIPGETKKQEIEYKGGSI